MQCNFVDDLSCSHNDPESANVSMSNSSNEKYKNYEKYKRVNTLTLKQTYNIDNISSCVQNHSILAIWCIFLPY